MFRTGKEMRFVSGCALDSEAELQNAVRETHECAHRKRSCDKIEALKAEAVGLLCMVCERSCRFLATPASATRLFCRKLVVHNTRPVIEDSTIRAPAFRRV